MIYKLPKKFTPTEEDVINSALRTDDSGEIWRIPFSCENTDYQQFKTDVLAGAELQDAEGNLMSPEEATAFIGTLP